MSSIERRAYLRYKIRIPVQLRSEAGAVVDTMTRDISLGGMQVEFDSVMMDKMLPQGIKTAPGDNVNLQVELRFSETSESVSLTTHVQGVQRMAESEFSVRFSFVDIDQVQQDQLQRLLNQ